MPKQKTRNQQFAEYWISVNSGLEAIGLDRIENGLLIASSFRNRESAEELVDRIAIEGI